MTAFCRQHYYSLERWSALLLAFGLGHWALTALGRPGLIAAVAMIFCAASFRVYLFAMRSDRPG